jgi:hypothetical protein
MEEDVAIALVDKILNHQANGLVEFDELIPALQKDFNADHNSLASAIEMVRTGGVRASIMSEGHHYPNSNVKIEENPVLKIAFKKAWVELKGEEHYEKNYVRKFVKKPWWRFF